MKLRHFSVGLPIVSPGPTKDDFLPDRLDIAVLGVTAVCLALVTEEFDVHDFQLPLPAELAHAVVFDLEVLFAHLAADDHLSLSHAHY
jgi:hypothetical protein